ncbi:hypothetical protein Aperf_G00000130619 [Anoplocephala perfoliata]
MDPTTGLPEEQPVVNWGNSERYKCGTFLRFCRFGVFFKCEDVNIPSSEFAIKIYHKNNLERFLHEVQIIKELQGSPNILRYHDILEKCPLGGISIILERFTPGSYEEFAKNPTVQEIPLYMHKLLQAIAECHRMNIMHRDIKPENVSIDRGRQELRLTDFGFATYYKPGNEYPLLNYGIYYEAPELTLGYEKYNCSIDIWSFSCMLAALLFRRKHFFFGATRDYKLVKIIEQLGMDGLNAYAHKLNLTISPNVIKLVKNRTKVPWANLITKDNENFVNVEAIDLLEKLFQYNPENRLSANEALDHPYFQGQ